MKHWPVDQIANVLGVSISTIERDIQAVEEYGQQYGADLMREPLEKTIWKITENYQERQMLRWQEFANAKSPVDKARILRDIQAEDQQYYETMQSLGAVYKAPEQAVVTTESWEDRIKRLRAEREAMLEAQGAPDGDDVDDAE
ncbi:hypothetical protein [Thermoanaerobacterium sp. DL9XJH110]|uniref:hypothetical protein n=1 Tax=Thermoanaerobacterium sp. DL9XJH110 TaxID=3386643 RepID=UPI003BB6160A